MSQESTKPEQLAASAGPACWAALHQSLRRALNDLGQAWKMRESNPIAADVCLLGTMRRLRGVLDECGVSHELSVEADQALNFADEIFATLQGM